MSNTNDVADELRAVAFVLRRLGGFRHHLTGDECLRIGELLRDCADQIDHGVGAIVTLPVSDHRETIVGPEQVCFSEVRVAVRQVAAPRPLARPARPRNVFPSVC
jgi:hypothetical protein